MYELRLCGFREAEYRDPIAALERLSEAACGHCGPCDAGGQRRCDGRAHCCRVEDLGDGDIA